ncbi:MAG: Gfo/Idh/MocA family oxidoreductase [Terrimicrobiaceae bacterium]|nr:Gfo/Idh/MocA family oxidoreductase [Terrimicrobiaceae bacterium]
MTTQTAIPVALIGCGAVSQAFYLPTLRALSATGEFAVHSLIDPSASARAPLAEAFPRAGQFTTLADAEMPAGGLAIVATPPRFHAGQTLESFARGWHVLCEKPMASASAECEKMIAAAESAQRLLAVGLYKRFFPSSRYLKDLIAGGQLGVLRSYSIVEGGPFKWPAATPSFFNKAQTPGGVLLDIGVHVLDLLVWWAGEPESLDYADDAMGGLETNARATLTHRGGAQGMIRLSRDWSTANEYRFEFEHGLVSWKVNDANNLTVQLAGTSAALRAQLVTPLRSNLNGAEPQPLATNPQSFIAQLQNVAAAIRGTQPLLIPGAEGIRSLRLIETCYREREVLDQPWFTPVESNRAQELAVQS